MSSPTPSSHSVAEPLRRMMNAMQMVPRHSSISDGSFHEAARCMTELAVTSLEVERAGIWLYSQNQHELLCQDVYAPMEEGHLQCSACQVSAFPDYIDTLNRQRLAILTDIKDSPIMTAMIHVGAFSPKSRAHLGAHIYSNGQVIGLFGMTAETPRPTWSTEERAFATYLCDVLGTVWQTQMRRQAEEDLHLLNESLEKQIEERTHQIQVQSVLMKAVLENITRGVGYFDPDDRLTLCNPQFLRILHLPSACGHSGTPLQTITAAQTGNAALAPLLDAIKDPNGNPVPFSLTLQYDNGHIIELEGIPLPSHDGVVLTCTDVTRRIQEEIEVREAHRLAQTANTALKKSLEELKQTQKELVEAEKLASLGGLVSGIAHEINTPVGIGLTAASLLAEKVDSLEMCYQREDLDAEAFEDFITHARETIQMVLSNIERAADLVRSFKNIATDSSQDEIRPVCLNTYIRDIIVSLTPRIRQAAVRVETDIPEDLGFDTYPGPLAQVITNLIINALVHAFTEPNPANTVWIRASLLPPREDGTPLIEIILKDNGVGVSPDHLGRLTEPFFTTKRGIGGTGLGLHIVSNIVTGTLRGTMTYDSRVGDGLAFTVRLPSLVNPHEHMPE